VRVEDLVDLRPSVRRWRHLDLGATRCFLESEICRVDCRHCHRVRTEEVPWARPGAPHAKDFQDVVCWLAQRVDKTTITKLLRVSWEAVAKIVVDVVADTIDDRRLDDLYRIGVDEVSYRKGHRFVTVVADHDRNGAVVWAGEGRTAGTVTAFYDELGPDRRGQLQAVSLDMGAAHKSATDAKAPMARQCVVPFHLVKLASAAVDKTRRWAWNEERRRERSEKGPLGRSRTMATPEGWIKQTRWALLKDQDDLKPDQLEILHTLRRQRSVLYRAWQLKEGIRDLYRLRRPRDSPLHLDWWPLTCRGHVGVASPHSSPWPRPCTPTVTASLPPSSSACRTPSSKVSPRGCAINHRGYGHHSAAALIAMIYLCCGGITVELPTERVRVAPI
jgi:transposase